MLGRFAAAVGAIAVLGAMATGASAAKPTLWLLHDAGQARAATGSPVHIGLAVAGECNSTQPGVLHSNGKPVDQVTLGSSPAITCLGSAKLAGSIKSVTAAPAGPEELAMTLNSTLHFQVAPWCTYSIPKKIVFDAGILSEARSEPTAPLDKAASFGSCPPITRVPMGLAVVDDSENFPFFGEVVG